MHPVLNILPFQTKSHPQSNDVPLLFSAQAEMYSCSFLDANKNTNIFEKNKKIQIRVKIRPQNIFENTKTNTFNLYIYSFRKEFFLLFSNLNELFM